MLWLLLGALVLSACQHVPAVTAGTEVTTVTAVTAVAPAAYRETLAPIASVPDPVVGRWRLASATTDNATVQGLGIKTSGVAELAQDGTGKLDMVARLGFISRARKAAFTWQRDGNNLSVHEESKSHPTIWKLISMSENRMEAQVPSGKQTLHMVFLREN